MSDKTREPPPARSAAGRILSGLAATAILGAPAAATVTPTAPEPVAATAASAAGTSCTDPSSGEQSAGPSIRDQFSGSFTPGELSEPITSMPTIICRNA